MGSAKLCKTAKGGEGLNIWDVDIKNYGAQFEHAGTIGKRSNKKHRFPKRNCSNHMEVKHTAQGLYAVNYLQGGHALDTTCPNISGCSSRRKFGSQTSDNMER